MVTILPRTRATFGEQIAAGMQRGADIGAQLGISKYQSKLQQKAKNEEIANRLKMLESPEHQEFFKGVDPRLAKLATLAAAGVIEPGVATSMAELIRQNQEDTKYNQAMGLSGEGDLGPKGPQEGMSSEGLSMPTEEMPPPSKPSSQRQSSKNYEREISKLQEALRYASTPQKRAQTESRIAELRRQQDRELKIADEESKRSFIPQEEYIKHAAKENAEFLNEVSQVEKDLPNTEYALAGIEDALGNANKWANFRDNIAERTGFEGARSAAGAELDSFIKNYFLGDLSSIKGGRANVFLEKQIRDAYPKAGRDPIANQKVAVGMHMKEKINRLLVEKTREMEEQEIAEHNYLRPGFKSRVRKAIKEEVSKIEKSSIDTLHHMSKIEENRDKIFRAYLKPGDVLMMDPEGQPYAVPKKEVSMYREQGYIPMGEK